MNLHIRAITLDLDDTLWPIAPVIARAESALDAWLREHAPRTAARWPVAAARRLRDEVAKTHPELAHDFTRQRLLTIEHMLRDSGDEVALARPAFDAFFAARCAVVPYDDSLDALARLAARVPMAAISNGNACLQTIGLMHLFRFQLGAREHGEPKPAASIFRAACARLGCAPAEVLHVGNDVELDVLGAVRAGLRSCWINRDGRGWPRADLRPDLEFATLAALADWLDARSSTFARPAQRAAA